MCLEMRLTKVMHNPVPLVFVVKTDFAQALVAIFGVGGIGDGQLEKLLLGLSEELGEGGIHLQKAPLGADPIESHGVVLEDRTRQLFTTPTALFSPFVFGDTSTESSIVSGKSRLRFACVAQVIPVVRGKFWTVKSIRRWRVPH